jgi:hypothetical protein
MNNECNNNLGKVLDLTEELKKFAHKGLSESNDDNCILLYGIIKDSCYKIKSEVKKEIDRYKVTR